MELRSLDTADWKTSSITDTAGTLIDAPLDFDSNPLYIGHGGSPSVFGGFRRSDSRQA